MPTTQEVTHNHYTMQCGNSRCHRQVKVTKCLVTNLDFLKIIGLLLTLSLIILYFSDLLLSFINDKGLNQRLKVYL